MPSTPDGSPLTEEHLAQINKGLEDVKRARAQIALARRSGLVDVSQQEAAVNDLEKKLLSAKQVYFPGR